MVGTEVCTREIAEGDGLQVFPWKEDKDKFKKFIFIPFL
jgi:hypothetical protein